MNNSDFIIAGFGELVYDHIFVKDKKGQIRYIESRAGGPIWNVLANLSTFGLDTIAIGVGGNDRLGRLAKSELQQLGVGVENLHLIDSKMTRVIFETLYPADSQQIFPEHEFSSKCLVCSEKMTKKDIPLATEKIGYSRMDLSGVGIICMDRFGKDRLSIIKQARTDGIITAIDFGRVSDLRSLPAVKIIDYLGAYDVVVISSGVADSIKRRAGLESISDILNVGSTSILCVTKAQAGVSVYLKNTDSPKFVFEVSGQRVPRQVDDAGAGDLFMSKLLYALIKRRILEKLLTKSKINVNVIEVAVTEAVNAVKITLKKLGARGHLPAPKPAPEAFEFERYKGKKIEFIQRKYNSLTTCPFCGLPKVKKQAKSKKIMLSRQNVSKLINRMLHSTERHEAIEKCQQLLNWAKTAYVIGTGGSFSSAVFISLLMSKERGIMAQALRPYDYIRTAACSDCLIVVSHSGKTKDCAQAIRHAKHLGVNKIVLITGTTKTNLSTLLQSKNDIISYAPTTRERGFVSIAATIFPCTIWTAAHVGTKSVAELAILVERKINGVSNGISSLKETLTSSKRVINVFGGGFAWPAMIDIESKFVEGGIGVALLHESKDFSHGRFISVLNNQPYSHSTILVRVGKRNSYENTLCEILSKRGSVYEVNSEREGILGALEVLIEVQFVIQRLAQALDIDISRPEHISPDGLRLYRWQQKLR